VTISRVHETVASLYRRIHAYKCYKLSDTVDNCLRMLSLLKHESTLEEIGKVCS